MEDVPHTTFATPSQDPQQKDSRSRWLEMFMRYVVILTLLAAGLGTLVAVLSQFETNLLAQATGVFKDWPSPVKVLAILGTVLIICVLTGWRDIRAYYHGIRNIPSVAPIKQPTVEFVSENTVSSPKI